MSHTLAATLTSSAHRLRARATARADLARRRVRDDDGLVLAEWILLVGIVAAAVIAIAAIIYVKITAKANELSL